jgi:hypothetical protein
MKKSPPMATGPQRPSPNSCEGCGLNARGNTCTQCVRPTSTAHKASNGAFLPVGELSVH